MNFILYIIAPIFIFFFTVAGLWLVVTGRRLVLFVACSVFFVVPFVILLFVVLVTGGSMTAADMGQFFFLLLFFEFFSLFVDLTLFQVSAAKSFFAKLILSSGASYFISFFYLKNFPVVAPGFQFEGQSLNISFVFVVVYFLVCSYLGYWLKNKLRTALSSTSWKIYAD